MKPLLALAAVAIVAIAAGCRQYEEVYSVTFRSNAGAELAGGSISLTKPLPASGSTRGWYNLQMRSVSVNKKEIEIFYQLFHGRESGVVDWTVENPRMGTSPSSLDFMPGFVDANIVARATPVARGYWRGRWSYSVFAGTREGGSFEIARK
ncbi:MAG TPA: hypothetical protein VN775_05090 [Opitutaceae bacterium]|nr:hypothetical protein [Opitutaceae bacterium]